jgi:DNA repair protein RadC
MTSAATGNAAGDPGPSRVEVYRRLAAWCVRRPTTAEAEPVPPDREEIVRFLKRRGWMPRTWDGRRAADGAVGLVRSLAEADGAEPATVSSVLLRFCEDGVGEAVCRELPACSGCPVRRGCPYPDRQTIIPEMPEAERPRERLLRDGAGRLSERELLAIVLRTGTGRKTALDLADELLRRFRNLSGLVRCTPQELQQIPGIGSAKAAAVLAALEIAKRFAQDPVREGQVVTGSRDVVEYVRRKFLGAQEEHFWALHLDTKHRVIREKEIAVGSLSESVVHPREVFKEAILDSAATVIFVHNHPSGNPAPSPQDRRLTTRLCEAGRLVGIQVLDHLIVGDVEYFSFAEHGLLTGDDSSNPQKGTSS